jgi:hypothetical protein
MALQQQQQAQSAAALVVGHGGPSSSGRRTGEFCRAGAGQRKVLVRGGGDQSGGDGGGEGVHGSVARVVYEGCGRDGEVDGLGGNGGGDGESSGVDRAEGGWRLVDQRMEVGLSLVADWVVLMEERFLVL